MEDQGTDLGAVLNNQPSEPVVTVEPAEPAPAEPVDQGVTPAEPPAAKPEPQTVPLTALQEERRKRQELEKWIQQHQQQPQPAEPLKAEDFADRDAYLEALAERKAEQAFEKRLKAWQEEQQQAAIKQQMHSDTAELMQAGAAKYADFADLVLANDSLPISEHMVNAMLVLDNGADVAYHLGKNPADAARIAQLPPTTQAREIAKIAKQVSAPPPEKPPVPRTLTTTRSANGQFASQTYTGPTPLNSILGK